DINECEVGEEGYDSDCHNCNNTKGSHTCSCNRGYKLSSNGKSCIDVNECDGVNGTDYNQDCHHCQNAEPGYTCECNDGYEADNSNLEGTCVGKCEKQSGKRELLLLSCKRSNARKLT
ncbi:hypothetical protein CAPTEDRAFT_142314, partial [Capitella teleta]